MKIGIITSFYSNNYGAALQAYAMQTYFQQQAHEVYLINYRNANPQKYILEYERKKRETISEYMDRRLKNLQVKLWGDGLDQKGVCIRNKAFDDFVYEYLNLTEKVVSQIEVEKLGEKYDFDAYVCGSDQIWNPIVHAFDSVYFADFDTNALKIAYAPSIAVNNLSDDEISIIAKKVKKMDSISVRERDAATILQNSKEAVNAEVVVDPTFLISAKYWSKVFKKKINEKYILVYILNYNAKSKKFYRYIEEYAIKNNCQIYWLPYSRLQSKKRELYKIMYDVSPAEFMNLLLNAECVFTNSFHATALSINNNINFYVFLDIDNGKTNIQSRLKCLIEEYELEERIITDAREIIVSNEKIDFNNINRRIMKRVGESKRFIDNALAMRK